MPYKDAERRRSYDRERKRLERATSYPVSPTRLPADFHLRVIEDVTALLEEAIQLIQNDTSARGIERGRAMLSACGIALRLAEARDVLSRLEGVERALAGRSARVDGFF